MHIIIFNNIQDFNLVASFRAVAPRLWEGCRWLWNSSFGEPGALNYLTLSMLTLAMLARTIGFVVEKQGGGRAGRPTTGTVRFLAL